MINKSICEFIADIEADPTAPIEGLTPRDLLIMKAHVKQCTPCYDSCERVWARMPKNKPIYISEN